jgi:hypothetical protein
MGEVPVNGVDEVNFAADVATEGNVIVKGTLVKSLMLSHPYHLPLDSARIDRAFAVVPANSGATGLA